METIDDLDELTELVSSDTCIYIRYSGGPDRDAEHASMDYEAGVPLPGLPVTNLWPEPWWPREPIAWIGDRAIKQAHERYLHHFEVGRDSTGGT